MLMKQSDSRMAHERNSVHGSVDVDVEPEVRQLSAAAQWMDANGCDSSLVKSRSHLDCVKANAPWRRRFVDCASPIEVTASNMSVIDGESAIVAAKNGPLHGARVAAEKRDGLEATIKFGAQVQTVCSIHRCFMKNTFIDIEQDDDGADVDTEAFDVPRRRVRSNSDSCIDYRSGIASASTDGFEQATENMEYSPVWMPWSTEDFVTVDENAENNANMSVYYQPYWFYVAGVSATAGEDVDDEQPAKTTAQQFVACRGDFDTMYALACPVVAYDFSGTNAEQTCYDLEKSQTQEGQWWNSSREARDRSISMGASSLSTAASAKDFQTSNKRPANIILRNIPCNFTREMLFNLLDSEGFEACYEFVYLPCDFVSESSLGYAFVIMITNEEAKRAIAHFQGYRDWNLASSKVCETRWGIEGADLQWHIERYRNSPVMHRSVHEKFQPALFRDGVQVAFPPPTRQIKAPGRTGTSKEDMHCPNTSVVISAQARHKKQH